MHALAFTIVHFAIDPTTVLILSHPREAMEPVSTGAQHLVVEWYGTYPLEEV